MNDPMHQWARVSDLFEHALELQLDERRAWITTHCDGDAALEAAVLKLLDADERAESDAFLAQSLPTSDPSLLDDVAPLALHDAADGQFGPYRLLRLIGQGGMGEVHLAERADGVFEQQVALKLLPRPTPGLMQRFSQERRILARLEHPNIARLVDGGIGEHGIPYFAMEYVEGEPINRYVAERTLDVETTLRLFLHVCDAVQYAHRLLVVHRDLKPSNILVTSDGQPKLLDFGIAKLLLATGDSDADRTATRVFTPDYAAPEQIRGEPVTTTTDVYSLGVVLYELLVGVRPYSLARDVRLEDAVVQIDPVAPSAMAVQQGNTQRRRQLRGDIDRIVLTMLAKEPARRYGSVEAMSNDIRRYLDGLPIAARGDNAGYRLRKFVRRNRIAIAASAIVAVALIGATVVSAWQAHRANAQAARAEAAKSFLVGVFSMANPDENGGKVVTAPMLLDDGVSRLDSEFATQPTLHAELLDLFGNLYYDIGNHKRAEELLVRAVASSAAVVEDATLYPKALIDLGQMERIRADYPAALGHENLARDRAVALGDKTLRTNARREIAQTLYEKGDVEEAEKLYRAVLDEDITLHGERSDEVQHDLHQLGLLLDRLTRLDESEVFYKRALELTRSMHGEMNTGNATVLNDYALMLDNKGDSEQAEIMMRQAIDLHTKLEGADHPNTLESENDLATILNNEGRINESLELLSQVLASRRRMNGDNHTSTATALNNIARPEFLLGDFESAEQHMREAIAIWTVVKGSDHPDTSVAKRNLAAILRADDKFEEAEVLGLQVVEDDRVHFHEESDAVAASRVALGRTQRFEGKYDEAFANFRLAMDDVRAAKVETTSSSAVLALQSMGETYLMQDKATDAKDILLRADELSRKMYAADNIHRADVMIPLGRSEHLLGNDAEAEKLLRPALQIRSQSYKPPNIWLAEAQVTLAEALSGKNERDEAKTLASSAAEALRTMRSRVSKQLLERAEKVVAKK